MTTRRDIEQQRRRLANQEAAEADRRALVGANAHLDTGAQTRGERLEAARSAIGGVEVLDETRALLVRYVVFPTPEAADAVTLFTAATHAQPAWEHATRLAIKSPLKRCGKSRLEEVMGELCNDVIRTTNISVAALVRSITDDAPPTLMLDEADSVFMKRRGERGESAEDLRGILNAGHARGAPYRRWNMTRNAMDICPTFAMAVVAGIGDLPDTIEDRAVVVTMRRRALDENVVPFRRRCVPELHDLRERLHEWVGHDAARLRDLEPSLPVEDRQADVWEPLVAIADIAGGTWPDRARQACVRMCGDPNATDATSTEELLGDLRTVFDGDDFVLTKELLERLARLEESPWAEWAGGRGLSSRALGRMLRDYGIHSQNIRLGPRVAKGYLRAELEEVWRRYLPSPTATAATALQTAEPPASPRSGYVAEGASRSATRPEQGRLGAVAEVAAVAPEGVEDAGRLLAPFPGSTIEDAKLPSRDGARPTPRRRGGRP